MFHWAVSEGKLPNDPTIGVTRQRIKNTTEGYRTWTDAEVDQFIAHHPIGTKPYLAFRLLLDTGARRGDVVDLGPQHIRHDLLPKSPHGYLSMVQGKTGTLVEVPVTDALPRNQHTRLDSHPHTRADLNLRRGGENRRLQRP
jgi:integrase